MAEVNVTPWLPEGWGGTADIVLWDPERQGFVLRDIKTQKGEGMYFVQRDGAKIEHVAQTSVYWHGLNSMGLKMLPEIGVYYLPKNDTRKKDELIEPVLVEFEPLPAAELHAEMARRHARTQAYLDSLPGRELSIVYPPDMIPLAGWLTDELESVQPRVQKLYFDRKTDTHELKLVPHWSAAFCPFPNELCDCSEQGTTKLGLFDHDGTYHARPGYEEIEPEILPD